jgi:hypothetical protein
VLLHDGRLRGREQQEVVVPEDLFGRSAGEPAGFPVDEEVAALQVLREIASLEPLAIASSRLRARRRSSCWACCSRALRSSRRCSTLWTTMPAASSASPFTRAIQTASCQICASIGFAGT